MSAGTNNRDEMIQRLEAALQQIAAIKTTKACINDKTTAFHNVQCVLSELKAGKLDV